MRQNARNPMAASNPMDIAPFTAEEMAQLIAVDVPDSPPRSRRRRAPSRDLILEAAVRCYFDWLTDAQIAAKLGIGRSTLARWKHREDFKQRLVEVAEITGRPRKAAAISAVLAGIKRRQGGVPKASKRVKKSTHG